MRFSSASPMNIAFIDFKAPPSTNFYSMNIYIYIYIYIDIVREGKKKSNVKVAWLRRRTSLNTEMMRRKESGRCRK